MTIRIEHLTIAPATDAWTNDIIRTGHGRDIATDETYRLDLLAVVRHIMRERGDCTMVPVIVGAVHFGEVNEFGHNGEVEVTYHARGYRAIYGVHFGERVTNVQCYMD